MQSSFPDPSHVKISGLRGIPPFLQSYFAARIWIGSKEGFDI